MDTTGKITQISPSRFTKISVRIVKIQSRKFQINSHGLDRSPIYMAWSDHCEKVRICVKSDDQRQPLMLGWIVPRGGAAVPRPPCMRARNPWARALPRAGGACPLTCSRPARWRPPHRTWLWGQASDLPQADHQELTDRTLLVGRHLTDLDPGEVAVLTKEMVVILVRQTLKAQPWEGEARSTCRITPGCFPGTSTAQVSTWERG